MAVDTDATYDGTIGTYLGVWINPLNPDPSLIYIEDIAHALSNSCRFTGHVKKFYSVAQHSVLASNLVRPELALTALLHDASEAYLSDISKPIKRAPEFGDVYVKYEHQLEQTIAEAFGLDFPWDPEIKKVDIALLHSEQRDLMPSYWAEAPDLLQFTIEPWSPEDAEVRFLERYAQLV